MKKNFSTLLLLLIVTVFSSVQAQDSEFQIMEPESAAHDNWFVSVGPGASLLIGEQDAEKSVSNRLRYSGELSVGKWFNPYFGMRIQGTFGQLRGFNFLNDRGGYYMDADRERLTYPVGVDIVNGAPDWANSGLKLVDDGFWQDFKYFSATADLMMNLTHLIRGYHKESPLDVMPFIGFGYMHTIKSNSNPTHDDLVWKLGLRANYNINKQFAVYLEPQAQFANKELDGYVGNRDRDVIANVFVGVQYNINKEFKNPASLSAAEIDMINRKLNEHRTLLENHQDILERQQRLLNQLEECCEETPAPPVAPPTEYMPEFVRFELDSHVIPTIEKNKLEDAVRYLKANPSKNILLIGYADKKTGNPKYNFDLSRKRSEAVGQALKAQGISPNRIILQWVGDKEQPFQDNEWNRVVVMVER